MTKSEFVEICNATCPHCRAGLVPTQRTDTKEWTHNQGPGGAMSLTICWASGFRNSRFADELTDG